MKKFNKILTFIFFLTFSANFFAAPSFALTKTPPVFSSNVDPYKAPEIEGITKWINSAPIKIADQKGKVVLIDFWTYSCINCIRTFPTLKKLHEKYASKGLVIIGVHSPEFEFEKDEKNVNFALQKFGITFPVAMDNNLVTWRNFENEYWPAHYLIDKNGKVVYMHFGEGKYDVLENNILSLLEIPAKSDEIEKGGIKRLFFKKLTPETYLGTQRLERNLNSDPKNLVFPQTLPLHYFAFQGNWNMLAQYSEARSENAALRLHFAAKKVFMVMSSADGKPIDVEVRINNAKVGMQKGEDVMKDSIVRVSESRLYELLNLKIMQDAVIEIKPMRAGLRVYSFTFGE